MRNDRMSGTGFRPDRGFGNIFDIAAHAPARLPPGHPPVLSVVIDTEEEFDWTHPFSRDNTGTTSIAAQVLAHERVFDPLGIVPTYVIDWPVATNDTAIATLKSLQDAGHCEIGTHLHPWVSPPHVEQVSAHNSYTGNLPPGLELEKLQNLTNKIAANFGRRPTVFKAGRNGLGTATTDALGSLGYLVDTSIVPHSSFRADGGPDYSRFDNEPFWFGPGETPILELPATTAYCGWLREQAGWLHPALATPLARTFRMGAIASRTGALERIRLSPEGFTAAEMRRVMTSLTVSGNQVFTLTYHSPSLVPGHTPYVRSQADLDRLLDAIIRTCRFFKNDMGGVFMSSSRIRAVMLEHHSSFA